MTQPQILASGEPFLLPGGSTGCLLVHGFTGSPKEMRLLGEFLHQAGHTVLGVRLSGHATRLEDMIRTRHQDWLASVEDGYHLLRASCEKIFLMGLSMGGVLSLIQAARLPVDGAVAMSTPYLFPNPLARRMPWMLKLLSPVLPAMGKSEGRWFNPEMQKDHIHYPKHPLRPAYELYLLLKIMRQSLPEIKIPVMVIQSQDDTEVPSQDAEKIFQQLGSRQKELVWINQANHVITRDGEPRRVFELVGRFIQSSPD